MNRKLSALITPLLSVLVLSMFASTVPIVSAKKPEWFYWNVYLWFPGPPPPWPYMMDSNVWWVYRSVGSENLYVREVVADNKYFFFRGVKDYVDIEGDGVVDGTYVIDMVIVWEWPTYPLSPGDKSIAGGFVIHSGTGCFKRMTAIGSAEVQVFWSDYPDVQPVPAGYEGLILVQYQEGYIVNSPLSPIV